MKFQNPFELFNNNLDKSNIESFENDTDNNDNNDNPAIKKKEFDYGIGFMIIILVTVFIIQICSYGITYFTTFESTKERIEKLKNPFWNVPYTISMVFFNFIFLFVSILLTINLKFGINVNPARNNNLVNLLLIVFILCSVLLLGSHILFTVFPSFIEIFENTIGYAVIGSPLFKTKRKSSLNDVFSKFKTKIFSNSFNINLSFLITLFTLSEFSRSFQIFIQDILSNDEVNDISQFSDIELSDPLPESFINSINLRKANQIQNDPSGEPYDFTSDLDLLNNTNKDVQNSFVKINELKEEIFELTVAKHTVGSFCWSYFISVIVFVGSINAFIT